MMKWNDGMTSGLSMQRTGVRESSPTADDGAMISIWCEWNGWRMAMARVTDLEKVCGSQANGAIYAQVKWTKVMFGRTPQTALQRPDDNYLRVCVLRSEVHPSAFEELSRRVVSVECR